MRVRDLGLNGPQLVELARHGDARGWFVELYRESAFAALGLAERWVQDNHSMSAAAGTVRGLHFQTPPHAQAKLVRVLHGSVLDVVVDVRVGSPTHGRHLAIELSAEQPALLYVPIGFAHGFCTTAPDTEVLYKVSAEYAPTHDQGLLWNDPALGINWPVTAQDAQLSDKDRRHPPLAELPVHFRWEAR